MSALLRDVRLAWRQLRRQPVFAASVLLSLALGIGVNTTVFSLANAVLFRAPEVAQPEQLVRLYVNAHSPFQWQDYQRLKDEPQLFRYVVEEVVHTVSFATGDVPTQAQAAVVSGDYYEALGLIPALGRFPVSRREDVPSAVPDVVLSHAFWTAQLGADPGIIGRRVRLNDRVFEVSAVAPAGFTTAQVLWAPELYVSVSDTPVLLGASPEVLSGSLYLTARLAPGVTQDAAAAQLELLFARAAAEDSARLAGQSWRLDDAYGITAEVRGPAALTSAFLLVVSVAVLLVASFNVGNLMLARSAGRAREIAIRTSLGAQRLAIARQMIVELALLALGGAVLALAAAQWCAALVSRLIPSDAGVQLDTGLDASLMAFTAALVALVVLVAGVLPAMQATRGDLAAGLREGATGGSVRRTRLRRWFLGGQVAASTVLVACASLFLHSLSNAREIDAGFDTRDIIDARIELGRGQDPAAQRLLLDQLLTRVGELPNVRAATLASVVPLTGSNSGTTLYVDRAGGPTEVPTYFVVVAPGYFETLGIPLIRGREFSRDDGAGTAGAAIVNATMAEQLWPDRSPLGQRVSVDGPTGPWLEVVGVSAPIRYNSLGESPPLFLYLPYAQAVPRSSMTLQLRVGTGASVTRLASEVVAVVRSLDPAIPPPTVRTLDADQRVVLLPAQVGAGFTGLLGMLALALAAVGIFGVAAFEVAQRTRELGIRAALGASAGRLLLAVVSDTARVVAVGAAVGLALALAAARVLASQLYGVGVFDPITFLLTPVVLLLVAVAAAAIPARRAVRVDPAVALRDTD